MTDAADLGVGDAAEALARRALSSRELDAGRRQPRRGPDELDLGHDRGAPGAHRQPGCRAGADPGERHRRGFVDTPLSAALLGTRLDARQAELRATLPVGLVIGPADVAELAGHLTTDTALTGATYASTAGSSS